VAIARTLGTNSLRSKNMFFTTNTNEQTPSKKQDVGVPEALGLLGLVLAAVGYQKIHLIERFYFNHFEKIYMIGAGVLAALALLMVHTIRKRTKAFEERALILRQVWDDCDGILAGRTDDGVDIHIPEDTRTGHTQILGATGKGKTISVIEPWVSRDIMNGRNVLLIDGKGDPELAEKVRAVTIIRGNDRCLFRVFDLGNPKDSIAVNPLQSGSAQQITDRIFTAFEFQDPYYKAVQYDITGCIVRLIKEVDYYEYVNGEERKRFDGVVTFKRVHSLLTSDDTLAHAVNESKDDALVQKLSGFLAQPKEHRAKQLSGLLSQIGPFAEGEVAHLVNGGSNETGKTEHNVSDIFSGDTHRQQVFVVLIPTLKYQQIGLQLGKLLLQELGWAVGERASQKGASSRFTPVYLDEFSSFVYPGFANILNKARSSNVALHLSHQSLGDLSQVSPDFAKIINTNTNIKCVLGLNDPETADWMARHLGTKPQEKLTEQAEKKGFWSDKNKTGRMSVREVEAYKIHPNLLKNFMNGRGVIHMPTPRGNLTEEIQFQPFNQSEEGRI